MTDARVMRFWPGADVTLSALAALGPAGILLWRLGVPVSWPTLLLPLSLSVFTFVWTYALSRLVTRIWAMIAGVVLGICVAHLMLWLPFLLVSYTNGQGAGRMGYSAFAAIVTAGAVGWYIMGQYLWQTVLFCAAIAGLVVILRRRRLSNSGETQ